MAQNDDPRDQAAEPMPADAPAGHRPRFFSRKVVIVVVSVLSVLELAVLALVGVESCRSQRADSAVAAPVER